MIDLNKLRSELQQDRYASIAIIYDRLEKKVLISGHGDDDILKKMMIRAINQNAKIKSAVSAVALLPGDSPTDQDIFNSLFGRLR